MITQPPPATTTTTTEAAAPAATAASSSFAYGSDVSWYTQMQASGISWKNNSGVQQNLYTILAGKGINAIRLRVWVNPSGGWCNTSDVVTKALAAKAAGMSILIDFHYSDTWADPGHQTVPAAWASQSFTTLMTTVYNYTESTLNTLKSNGITPTWVQVGNETNNGMLWPNGEASVNMKNYAWLVNCGYNATKAVFPSCKVIVHLANGYDTSDFSNGYSTVSRPMALSSGCNRHVHVSHTASKLYHYPRRRMPIQYADYDLPLRQTGHDLRSGLPRQRPCQRGSLPE